MQKRADLLRRRDLATLLHHRVVYFTTCCSGFNINSFLTSKKVLSSETYRMFMSKIRGILISQFMTPLKLVKKKKRELLAAHH